MSKLAYRTADRLYAATESTDRANRGVKTEAWVIAGAFSAVVWFALFKIIF